MKFIFLSTSCQSLKEVNNYDRTQTNASYFPERYSDWACLDVSDQRNAQKINKEEITVWRGPDMSNSCKVLIFICLDALLFRLSLRSPSFPHRVENNQLLFISVATLVCCLLLDFCLHEWVFLQVKRMNSLLSSPFDPEPAGQTDRSTHMINTAQLQVWVICICINRGKKKKTQQQLNYIQRHSAY